VSYSLVNVPTTDAYPQDPSQPGVILRCPGARSIALTVGNAAVLYQLGRGYGAIEWESVQHFAVPGVWTIHEPADAIQARSAVPGVAAQVSVSAYAA
jgi:hypothetical protein